MVIGVYHQGGHRRWQPLCWNEACAWSGAGAPGRMAKRAKSVKRSGGVCVRIATLFGCRSQGVFNAVEKGVMIKGKIINRLRFIFGCGVMGGVTASMFFGWIDRSVDMQTIGMVIGAGAATLTEFDIV